MRGFVPAFALVVGVSLAGASAVHLPAHAGDSEPAVIATVPVGAGPWGVAITPDSKRAFIGNSGVGSTGPNNVSVIDLNTRSIIREIRTGDGAAGVAITPDGAFALVANYRSWQVSKIDTTSYVATESPIYDPDLLSIAASPDSQFVYVVCEFGRTLEVRVSDLTRREVVRSQPGGTFDIAVNATQQVYVGGAPGGQVGIVADPGRFATLTSSGTAIALSPDGNTAYVGDTGGRLYVFNLATTTWNTAVATYALGGDIRGIAVTPDGTQAYVTDRIGNVVRVVDLTTGVVLHTLPVGNSPQRVAISANGLTAVVTNNASGTVSIIAIPAADSPTDSPTGPSSEIEYETLTLAHSDQVWCLSPVVTGVRGAWVQVPGKGQCSVAGESGHQILGWATDPGFPTDIARRQVVSGWGAYESRYPTGALSAVFIPAGGYTNLTSSVTLYPILGEM